MDSLFCGCGVSGALYLTWVVILYQLHSLQIFCPILLVPASLCWRFPLQCSFLAWCNPMCLFQLLLSVLLGSFPRSLCLCQCLVVLPWYFFLIIWGFQDLSLDACSSVSWFFFFCKMFKVRILFHTSTCEDSVFQHYLLETILYLENDLDNLSKSDGLLMPGLISGFSIQFCPIGACVCFCTIISLFEILLSYTMSFF